MSDQRRSSKHQSGGHKRADSHRVVGPEVLPVKRPVCALAEDVEAVREGGTAYILCGEAHPDVYNAERVRAAFTYARRQRHANIVVVTGPILLVHEREDELNGLIALFEDGLISELYHRRRRFTTNHFRVVESDPLPHVYSECTHPPLMSVKKRLCENLQGLTGEQMRDRAREGIDSLNFWKARSVAHRDAHAHRLPLLTTPNNLTLLMERARLSNVELDYLDADELMALQPDGAGWLTPLDTYRERPKVSPKVHV